MEEAYRSLPNSRNSAFDNAGAHVDDGGGSVESSSGARYKLMSPEKFPISRSTCTTIPPGLSPTSFLESPVQLSSIKAEPSPITGSLSKPPVMHGSGENVAISQDKNSYGGANFDERTSSRIEFKFHTGSAPSRFSSLAISSGLKHHVPFSKIQDQHISHSPAHEHKSASSNYEPNQGRHSNSSSYDQKDSISNAASDRTSDDGYNWRKYGQKLVKGSEFPRSYFKCTYPSCEVKKIFESSPSGQILEIVYKGSHDHPKPASRRHNPVEDDISNINRIKPNISPALSPKQANEVGADGSSSKIQNINNDLIDDDDPFSKRRKMEDGFNLAPVVKPIREPRVVVQTVSEVDILDDGYRWRKYGQKVVRGNPNPRSYYKCTNPGCPVRKHVERASHDFKAVITSYEGKHDHDVPTAKNSNCEFSGTTPCAKITSQESGSLSLDLVVGTNSVEVSRTSASYGIVNSGMNLYGSRENRIAGSYQCTPTLGRILMGP